MADLFGTTDLEKKAEEKRQCNEIVAKIMDFGVTQRQIFILIKKLALELENIDHSREIVAVVEELASDINIVEKGELL